MTRLFSFRFSLALLAMVAVMVVGCSGGSNVSSTNLFTDIAGADNGIIRGLQLGEGLDEVKALETAQPASEDDDYLVYNHEIDPSNYWRLEYTFNASSELYEILIDIWLDDESVSTALYSALNKRLTTNLGDPAPAGESAVIWNTTNDFSNDLEVTLKRAQLPSGIEKIELTVFNHDN